MKIKNVKQAMVHIELPYSIPKAKLEKEGKCYLPLANGYSRGSKKNGPKLDVCKVKLKVKPSKVKLHENAQLRDACLALCGFPDCIENAESAAMVFLLTFLSQVAHLLVGITPAMPAVILDCAAPASVLTIQTLLRAFQGPEKWKGKGWELRCPHIVLPRLALGETKPSVSLYDYIGGKFRDDVGKKRKFYFPVISSTVALMPDVPSIVVKEIAQISPTALLLVFTHKNEAVSHPLLPIKDAGFDTYDKEKVDKLDGLAEICYGEIITFLVWFCKKKKHIQQWRKGMDCFRPVAHQGRFSKPQSDNQTEWLCAGLALFRQFLLFASEKVEWITTEEAHDILIKYWRLVLPASAPNEDSASDSIALAYDDPQVFYSFLIENYLPTYHNQIMVGAKGESGTMGLIHMLDGKQCFIAPRQNFLKVYGKWLAGHGAIGFDLSSIKGEAIVQGKLREAGVPIHGEKNNPSTWRFQYYKDSKDKINCLALPIAQLPDWVQAVFGVQFGVKLPAMGSTTHSDAAVNNKEEVNPL